MSDEGKEQCMAHSGTLENQQVAGDVRDIRGTTVRGPEGEKLGKVDDVIFDHDTMEIRYLVVDSEGWLESGTFLLPAHRVFADEEHEDGLATGVSTRQIRNAPQYDKTSLRSQNEWNKYEQEFKEYWEEDPVMHIKGSDRIITPPEEPAPAQAGSAGEGSSGSGNREVNAAELFPERMTKVFTDPEPSISKVTLRPKSVARAEEAASGVTLLKPRWWEAFENYLRINKPDIQANCPQCPSAAEGKREVA
jgi:sporulation protein YlmC with PRC-barrel domain